MSRTRTYSRGITLVEVLCVVSIIASLAAIAYPIIPQTISTAKRTTCLSNLMQIGYGLSLYTADHDDKYPYAVNAIERTISNLPLGLKPEDNPKELPLVNDVLGTYCRDPHIWQCPMDSGRDFGRRLSARPHFHSFNGGSSYFTIDLVRGQSTTGWSDPSRAGYAMDASTEWHSPNPKTLDESLLRHNVLYFDCHVKNVNGKEPQITYLQ